MSAMGEAITTSALTQKARFPFVRVPMFEVIARQTRELAGVEIFSFNPFVSSDEYPIWRTWSKLNAEWYQESLNILQSSPITPLLQLSRYQNDPAFFRDVIWDGADNQAGYVQVQAETYAPVWQMSPPPFSVSFINFGMLTEGYARRMVPLLEQTREGLMTEVDPTLGRLSGLAITPEDHDAFHRQYVENVYGLSYFDHPHSIFLQPIFGTLQRDRVVGFLSALIPWDRFMAGLLPENVNGIVAVLNNNCGQSYTYELKGHKVRTAMFGRSHLIIKCCSCCDRRATWARATCTILPLTRPWSRSP